jgi:hypothetical protein
VRRLAHERGCRDYLDFGSGIGSDALVFASVGCRVTLADISGPLLAFAKWRCERRGFDVRTIDLKIARPPRREFDAVVCFDVLEHIHRPLRTLDDSAVDAARRDALHARPVRAGPDRPIHVAHEDVVTPRMRTVGFHRRDDLETRFPRAPGSPVPTAASGRTGTPFDSTEGAPSGRYRMTNDA